METINEYLDYAELAQVAYGIGFVEGMYQSSYTKEGVNILTHEDYNINFSTEQAINFANRYEVKAVADPYLTGLDAVLFYDHDSNKYILSIRGTSSVSDVFSDILLANKGVAYDQLAALDSFYNQWLLDGIIPIGAKLDVTGHSLGGALAQSFALAHPNEVDSVYSYNAPGIGGLSNEAYEALGIIPGTTTNTNITNIYAKEGLSVTAGLGTMIGSVVPISIDEGYLTQNHSIPRLTESLHIYNMLSSIANTQDINLLTNILENTTNEKAIKVVSDIFEHPVSGDVVEQAIELTKMWSGDATGITSLIDKPSSQLQSRRVENVYALLNVNSFILEGSYLPAYENIDPNDYSDLQISDRADFLYYNLHQEEAPTDTVYIDNRNGITIGSGINQVIFGSEYNDTNLNGSSGDDRIYGNEGNDVIHGDSSNAYITQSGDDYIEGGKGNDTIYGDGGNDYLDGGTGDDTLSGGADHDTLMGGSGNDVLYGNSGEDVLVAGENEDVLVGGSSSDTLLGQAGDDVLVGGNGLTDLYSEKTYDYLVGGSGYDTYYVSHQDIINDADLNGFIMFNGKTTNGTKTKVEGSDALYEDANFLYAQDGSNMIVIEKATDEYITIENNFNSYLKEVS